MVYVWSEFTTGQWVEMTADDWDLFTADFMINNVLKINEEAATDENNVHTATTTYQVQTDSKTTAVNIQLSGDSRLPTVGEAHPDDSSLQVKKVQTKRIKESHWKHFTYIVNYSSQRDRVVASGSPLARPPRVRWTTSLASEAYFVDQDNWQVVNSAGQPFDEMPERDRITSGVTITVNQSRIDVDQMYEFSNTVNLRAFTISDGTSTWIIPKLLAKIGAISASELKIESDIKYYEVTYPISIRKEGWLDVFLDQGYYEIVNGELQEIRAKGQRPIKKPAPLNGSGHALSAGSAPAELVFRPYRRKDHQILPLR